jgi:hemerythrin-like metal-binding protein
MVDNLHHNSIYDKFIPYKLLEMIGKGGIDKLQLGDQIEKRVTVLFADIRNFTTLSELMSPQENINFINDYLNLMEPVINKHDGIIDKYIGDAIMAIFPDHPDNALDCAINMLKKLEDFNLYLEENKHYPIKIGIGINTGLAMIGTVGSANRMEGTVISDAVNFGSRIEGLTKTYGVDLLISENTYNSLSKKHREYSRFIDRVLVKGKHKPQSIYEVYQNDPEDQKISKRKTNGLFEEALAHYHYLHVKEATNLLNSVLQENPNDVPALIYLKRCHDYATTGQLHIAQELKDRISWSNIFLIDQTIIDKQHKVLVNSSLELITAIEEDQSYEVLTYMMNALKDRAVEHFIAEEKIMEDNHYPLITPHKLQHETFIETYSLIIECVLDKGISQIFKMFKVQIFLIDWLVNHTLKEDKHFGKYLKTV